MSKRNREGIAVVSPQARPAMEGWFLRRNSVRFSNIPVPPPSPAELKRVYENLFLVQCAVRSHAMGDVRVVRLIAECLPPHCQGESPLEGTHAPAGALLKVCQMCDNATCPRCLTFNSCYLCGLQYGQCRDCERDFVYTCEKCHRVEKRMCPVCLHERDTFVKHTKPNAPRHLMLCRACIKDHATCYLCCASLCYKCTFMAPHPSEHGVMLCGSCTLALQARAAQTRHDFDVLAMHDVLE